MTVNLLGAAPEEAGAVVEDAAGALPSNGITFLLASQ